MTSGKLVGTGRPSGQDDAYHARRQRADERRDLKLYRCGFRVVRVSAELVRRDLGAALAIIRAALYVASGGELQWRSHDTTLEVLRSTGQATPSLALGAEAVVQCEPFEALPIRLADLWSA